MIYFDNAATGGFKPGTVCNTAETVMRFLSANPGRSGHRLSVTGAKIVYSCRESVASLFNAQPERVIFTKNCTEALNTAIFGTQRIGNVITTVYEHNSVLRPLYELERRKVITLTILSPQSGKDIPTLIEERIKDDTYMIVTTAVSNVTGESLPIEKIGEVAKRHKLLYLLDGAQGGGHIPIDLKKDNVSMLALAGHKGLYGIMGSGVLVVGQDVEVSPLTFGGTGTETFSPAQPQSYPEKLEAGTLDLPAIASLKEGVDYVRNNLESFGERLKRLTEKTIEGLSETEGVKCYSTPNSGGIVAFSVKNAESNTVADILNSEFDTAVRGGFHCAPLMHKYLKTENCGLIRASFAVQNTEREINFFLHAVHELSKRF